MKKPAYLRIKEELKAKLLNGEFPKDRPLYTEKELSELYSVSRITSKRALTELQNEGLVIRRQGSGTYAAEPGISISDSSGINASKLIALVLPFDVSNGGMLSCVEAASDALHGKGYFLNIQNSASDVNTERNILNNLLNEKVGGVILYPISEQSNIDVIYRYRLENRPLVTIDKRYEGLDCSSVVSENYTGGYLLAEHLINCEQGKIAFISNIPLANARSIKDRYLGYCKALFDNNIQYDDKIVRFDIEGDYNSNSENYGSYLDYIGKMVQELIDYGVTAIQASNDVVAMLITRVCNNLNIQVPGQLSIVGFDAIDAGKYLKNPLTTVRQNFYSIGKTSVEIILNEIEKGNRKTINKVIPTSLILRNSTKSSKTGRNYWGSQTAN